MSRKTVKGKKIQIKSDTLLSTFWKDKQHFADLFNTCLFGGETVIQPEQLEEQDSVSSELLVGERWIESVERIRDVIKMSALGTDFVLLGIENQNRIHVFFLSPDAGAYSQSRIALIKGKYAQMWLTKTGKSCIL